MKHLLLLITVTLTLSASAQESDKETIIKYYSIVKESYVLEFKNATIKNILDTLATWNNYTVKYNTLEGFDQCCKGIIRKQDFKGMLSLISNSQNCTCKIEGNIIIINPDCKKQ